MMPATSERAVPSARVPPHNLQAEESLLGAMLLSRDAIGLAVELVDTAAFYKPTYAHIYDAIVSLYSRGEPVDPVTVAEELARADLLDAVGGAGTLVELQANTPAISNVGHYARIVDEHALLRRMIGIAGEIAEIGYGLPDDVPKAVDEAEAMMYEVAEKRVTDSTRPIRELLSDNLDRLEELYDRGEAITGLPTGYTDLDELLSGLQPSTLMIVGARPSVGKTALALGMATHVAVTEQKPVLFFSLEMGHLELTQRILSAQARVDSTRMRNGKLSADDWQKITNGVRSLAEATLFIDDNPHLTVMEIRAKARRLRSRVGELGMIVVDYLQLMSGRQSVETRQLEVSEISRGLKILARELETPVVALSQLSRNLESRTDKRPMLSDLRESGCLTAKTRIVRADTGRAVTLGSLLESGETDIPIWTLDERYELVGGTMTHVFASGLKMVYELRLASGRRVEASANHPFLTLDGWLPLGDLMVGDRIASARQLPEPTVGGRGFRRAVGVEMQSSSVATLARHVEVTDLARSDVLWDKIVDIRALGVEPVYDATVPETHNFVADGVIVHNSLEQDSDVVLFIYRDEVYDPDSPDIGTAELIVSKHRNGPTGKVRVAFLNHYAKFVNMTRGG